MIRALRGQLSHRRAQAQFQRILREPDPLLRAALPAVAMPAVNHESTGKNQTHTGKQHPHNVRQLEHHQSDDRKATARKHSRYYRRDSDHPATSTPAGATGTVVARNHHPTLATEYHVLEFNPEGADFPANSTRRSTRRSSARARPTHHPSGRSGHGQVPTVNTIAEPHRIRT